MVFGEQAILPALLLCAFAYADDGKCSLTVSATQVRDGQALISNCVTETDDRYVRYFKLKECSMFVKYPSGVTMPASASPSISNLSQPLMKLSYIGSASCTFTFNIYLLQQPSVFCTMKIYIRNHGGNFFHNWDRWYDIDTKSDDVAFSAVAGPQITTQVLNVTSAFCSDACMVTTACSVSALITAALIVIVVWINKSRWPLCKSQFSPVRLPEEEQQADAIPDGIPDAVPDAIPDGIPDGLPDAVPDAVPDASAENNEPRRSNDRDCVKCKLPVVDGGVKMPFCKHWMHGPCYQNAVSSDPKLLSACEHCIVNPRCGAASIASCSTSTHTSVDCTICQGSEFEDDVIVTLPCFHKFHKTCLVQLVETDFTTNANRCSLCRMQFFTAVATYSGSNHREKMVLIREEGSDVYVCDFQSF